MRIDLAGYGPGSSGLTTQQVRQALEEAELIITSERLAGYVRNLGRTDAGCTEEILIETNSSEICRILEDTAYDRVVCLMSGDSSFYSGALKDMEEAKKTREYMLDIAGHPNWFDASYISWL